MSGVRLFAVAVILGVSAIGWMVLGGSVQMRTESSDQQLRAAVGGLWGEPQVQTAPTFARVTERGGQPALPIAKSDLRADFKLDERQKGLLWYATYGVGFRGAYTVSNDATKPITVAMIFPFPVRGANYDGFGVKVDGKATDSYIGGATSTTKFTVPARSSSVIEVAYRTQGLDSWAYAPSNGVGSVNDFSLVMSTDFPRVDFPDGAVSPTEEKPNDAGGVDMTWRYTSLVSGRAIALTMPKPLNPGPIASRISVFAPVSLIFFFAAMVLLTATRGLKVHPMNYAFLAAGFFAFDLLFAYLVDHIDINLAFAISAVTSLGLCVGYLARVIGWGRPLVEAAVGQFIFLVLFSYSFFYEGFTGLTIAIGAVLTLGYFMARTGHFDWDEAFRKAPRVAPIPTFAEQKVGYPGPDTV